MNPKLSDLAVIQALAQPVRLDILSYLMAEGPRTASECARAVGDSPSNCSYHLRVLRDHGLVVADEGTDRRTRPWRATISGFSIEQGPDVSDEELGALLVASLQLDQRLASDYLRGRDSLAPEWAGVEAHRTFGLQVTPDELRTLIAQVEATLEPYVAGRREDPPADAAAAHFTMTAFPRPAFDRTEADPK